MAASPYVKRFFEAAGCKNPLALPGKPWQYMYWVEDTHDGVIVRDVLFIEREDFLKWMTERGHNHPQNGIHFG